MKKIQIANKGIKSNNIDTKNIDKKERRKLATEQQMAKLNSQLPPEYVANRELLLGLPIVDLVDKLFMLFGLDQLEGQSSYICTLYDTIKDFLLTCYRNVRERVDIVEIETLPIRNIAQMTEIAV